MNAKLTHKLEFTLAAQPMLSELEVMIETALRAGFPRETPVYIRAGTDERDHDYSFHATVGRDEEPAEVTP